MTRLGLHAFKRVMHSVHGAILITIAWMLAWPGILLYVGVCLQWT